MGLFSKKNKNNTLSDNSDYDMFDIVGNTEENLSADQYPELSYDDMEGFDFPEEDSSDKKSTNDSRGSRFRRMFIGGTAVILVFIAALYFTGGDDSSNGDDRSSEQQQEQPREDVNKSSDDSSSNDPDGKNTVKKKDSGVVATEQIGQEYETDDDGNPINGTGAIMAFDHAYYTKRDGQAAREMFNPEADAYNAEYIQRAIDKVPQGTTYSLSITPVRIGEEYKVDLTLNLPGAESPSVYNQKFYTKEKNGQYYVESFTSQSSKQ